MKVKKMDGKDLKYMGWSYSGLTRKKLQEIRDSAFGDYSKLDSKSKGDHLLKFAYLDLAKSADYLDSMLARVELLRKPVNKL